MKDEIFLEWLSNFNLGWMPIALFKERQIFIVTDFREDCRYFFVMANSRKDVMEWIINFGYKLLSLKNSRTEDTLKWFSCKKGNRGKVQEYFEIIRLLEEELPTESFPVYETIGELSFKTYVNRSKSEKKKYDENLKSIFRFSEDKIFCPSVYEFEKGWNWDFNEAVFQIGIFIREFERMYLLRCLYRSEDLKKKFLGWKVQLLRGISDSKDLVNPFWNISLREEDILKNLLQRIGFSPKKIFQNVNTPEMERKRRHNFQKKCKFLI